MFGKTAPKTGRLSDGLYHDILTGIMMGDYPPKSTLPTESRLAQDYGISRTIVRSALESLKVQGLVQSRQGSGTIVANFDPSAVAMLSRNGQLPLLKDCYACRLAIEPEIAAIVAQNMSRDARDFLEDQRDILKGDEGGSEYERSARDAHFHIRLAELSGNAFFSQIMNTLRPHMLFAMNVAKTLATCSHNQNVNLSEQEHLVLIDALLDQNADATKCAMIRHLELGAKRMFRDSATEDVKA
jgi:DNA-binding FadR family transcriptional regulator